MQITSDIRELNKLTKDELIKQLGVLSWLIINEFIARNIVDFKTMPLQNNAYTNNVLIIDTENCIPLKPTIVSMLNQ